jgi:uncharacterized protein
MQQKKTLVIGASDNESRYSNMAVKKLLFNQQPVIALGKKAGSINGVTIQTEKESFEGIDTVTLYVNPTHQQEYYDYIFSLKPKRIIFNPGTENEDFAQLAAEKGIEIQEACTLVMLNTGQY